MDLRIIGFPSNVIVEGGEELIIDPFNSGKHLSVDDLLEILNLNFGKEVELVPEYLNEITTEEILIRILRNLKSSYKDSYSYNQSLRCNMMILAINPNSSEEIRDAGILEEKMQNYEKATEFLNKYLELLPNAEDADFILQLIKKMRKSKFKSLLIDKENTNFYQEIYLDNYEDYNSLYHKVKIDGIYYR